MLHLPLHIFLYFLLCDKVLAQTSPIGEYPVNTPEDAIAILYNGTISGTYTGPSKNCTTYSLGPYRKSYFTFGTNPPWDPNPFFFQLDHQATEYTGGGFTYTKDTIWALWTLSADRVLNVSLPGGWEPGDRCRECPEGNKTVAQVWDLKAAEMKLDKGGNGEGVYNISGGPETFLGKGAIDRLDVDVTPIANVRNFEALQALGCIGTDPLAISSETTMRFDWTPSSKPTYKISISNSTANVTMTLTTLSGFLTLSFTGTRLDYAYQSGFGNFDNVTLSLDTSNPAVPSFTYTNGSKFSWIAQFGMNYTDGPWQPLAEGARMSTNTTKKNEGGMRGAGGGWGWSWWVLGVVGLGVFI